MAGIPRILDRPVPALLLLALLAAAAYHGSLASGFHYDDEHSIVRNPGIRHLGNLPRFFVDPGLFSEDPGKAMYRPVLLCSYALNHALDGNVGAGYHLANLAIHVLAAWMVYFLAGLLHSRHAGLVASLLFVVHPLTSEPVNYVSSRSESLAALFCLASINLHLRARTAVGTVAYALGLLTKSTAIALPLLLAVWELPRGGTAGSSWRRFAGRLAPYLVVSLAYAAVVQGFVRQAFGRQQVRSAEAQILTQLKALVYYAKLMVLPNPLSVEHPFAAGAQVQWVHVAAAAALGSLVWLAAARGGRGAGRAVAAVGLPLAPVAIVPLNVLVNEHRVYLSLALGAVALALLACRGSLGRTRLGVGVLIGVVGLWTWRSAGRTEEWRDDLTLWRQALEVAPRMPRTHFLLAEALRRNGQSREAEQHYLEADRLFGGSAEVQLNLGALYLERGDTTRARAVLEPLGRQQPQQPQALYNLALALQEEAPDRALALLQQAQSLRPDLAEVALALASKLDSRGELDRAREVLQEFLQRRPESADGWNNLGQVRGRAGDWTGARQAWERALQLEPGLPQARANLDLLDRMGK